MSDLHDRFKALDEIREPDLWPSILVGTPSRTVQDRTPAAWNRVLAAALSLVLATTAGMAIFHWAGNSGPAPSRPGTGHRVVLSVLSKDRKLRCTATLPTDRLAPGLPVGMRFSLTNVSDRRVSYDFYTDGEVILRDSSGKVLWDPRERYPFPVHGTATASPMILKPGITASIPAAEPRIWWSGHLNLDLRCLGKQMGVIPAKVAVPGPPPSASEALDRALSRTHGLFDRCWPSWDRSWTTGTMVPPDGADVPPMRVRCSAQVDRHPGFDAVSIYFVSPPETPPVTYPSTTYQLGAAMVESLPGRHTAEAGRWLFVVTSDEVHEVAGLENVIRTTGGGAEAPEYELYKGRWSRGSMDCFDNGLGWGGGVVFISRCAP